MSHPKLVTLLILSLAVARSPAVGQTVASPYTFIEHSQSWSIFAGKSNLNPGQLGLGPRDATLVGGRYAVAFGGAMSLDLDGNLFLSARDIQDASRPPEDRTLARTDFSVLLVDVKLRLNVTGQRAWHGLQPFVLFGAGVAFATFTDRTVEQTSNMPRDEWFEFGTRFTGTFGGGVNYHVSDKISLRLDGMFNLWKLPTPIGWRTLRNDPLGLYPEGEWVTGKSFKLGAAWRF